MTVVLRAYDPSDFDKLFALDHQCFPHGIAYSRRMLAYFLQMPQGSCIVATDDSAIAGFLITEQEGPLAHVLTLDVAERYRRQGVGTLLLERGENELTSRGVREIVLETSVENAAGLGFWQRHDYRTVAVRKHYYLSRIDAFEMRKIIAAPEEI
jgi:[ribosomal protein S18]-alanine N-acetyltransferase